MGTVPYDRKYKELKLDHVGHLHFLGVVFLQRCSAAREEDGPNLSADQQKAYSFHMQHHLLNKKVMCY